MGLFTSTKFCLCFGLSLFGWLLDLRFGLLLLFLFLLFQLGSQQFENGKLRAVSDSEACMNDARVPARAVGKSWSDIVKQFFCCERRKQIGSSLTACVQRIAFAEGDDFFHQGPRGLCTPDGRRDALFLDDIRHQIAQRGAAMRRLAAQLSS